LDDSAWGYHSKKEEHQLDGLVWCYCDKKEERQEKETILYKGHSLEVLIDYATCLECSMEYILNHQIHINESRIRELKISIDKRIEDNK